MSKPNVLFVFQKGSVQFEDLVSDAEEEERKEVEESEKQEKKKKRKKKTHAKTEHQEQDAEVTERKLVTNEDTEAKANATIKKDIAEEGEQKPSQRKFSKKAFKKEDPELDLIADLSKVKQETYHPPRSEKTRKFRYSSFEDDFPSDLGPYGDFFERSQLYVVSYLTLIIPHCLYVYLIIFVDFV